MRFFIIIILSILAIFASASISYGAEIKRYLYIPSFNITQGNGFVALQVNQRIIIRLQRTQGARRSSLSRSGNGSKRIKYEERKIGKCIAMDKLLGFSPGPAQSLEFLTKDRQLIRAYLSDNCQSKEFYAGAYIEKPKDGKLCRKRDIIHARYGSECELDRFRLLVPETS